MNYFTLVVSGMVRVHLKFVKGRAVYSTTKIYIPDLIIKKP